MGEHGTKGSGASGLPTYVILDTSASMAPHQELLNETLEEIYDTLISSPQVMEFVHLSVIAFNTTPNVVVGITELEGLQRLPEVSCGGSTNYAPMFELLKAQIDRDVPTLSATGINVFRPVVFLLTDGGPTDISAQLWDDALAKVKDPAWRLHPHIITYGFGDTGEAVLKRVATLAAYLAENGTDNRQALSSALSSLLKSLVSTAEKRELQVPISVPGYRSVALDLPHEDYVEM